MESKAPPASEVTIGRIVHYVLADGQHRPAVVVQTWNPETSSYAEGVVNLQVFMDGTNDLRASAGLTREQAERGLVWVTSVHPDESKAPGTWHWAEIAE